MLLFTARNAPSGYTSIGDLARHHPSANRKSWTQKRIQIQENWKKSKEKSINLFRKKQGIEEKYSPEIKSRKTKFLPGL
tara:strand:+ start:641 stop:877 length:237 start_codon:yes stop_codon:yes gene_type:complete